MKLKLVVSSIFQYIRQKPVDVLLTFVVVLLILQLSSLYFSVSADDGNWEQFKVVHGCELLTTKTGNQRLSWKCDDGRIYYRWRQQR